MLPGSQSLAEGVLQSEPPQWDYAILQGLPSSRPLCYSPVHLSHMHAALYLGAHGTNSQATGFSA